MVSAPIPSNYTGISASLIKTDFPLRNSITIQARQVVFFSGLFLSPSYRHNDLKKRNIYKDNVSLETETHQSRKTKLSYHLTSEMSGVLYH